MTSRWRTNDAGGLEVEPSTAGASGGRDHGRLTEDILGAMAAALHVRDVKGVIGLWKMLAIADPDLAAGLMTIVRSLPDLED